MSRRQTLSDLQVAAYQLIQWGNILDRMNDPDQATKDLVIRIRMSSSALSWACGSGVNTEPFRGLLELMRERSAHDARRAFGRAN